jgi:hypothetical protein
MTRFSTKRRIAAAAVIILLMLFLVRPGASRLKNRITISLSKAVDRPVDIGSVHLRFLPQPGFDLENVVIYEDPAFGAEPMLRAPEVTAVVRLTSLLRGRIDVSRLELTEPSLNLVRRLEDSHWNWEPLLERSARVPLAPTAKSKLEPRPGFPYIEATSGRINIKIGAEKKPYALLDADFALWQESENVWGVRLKAQPLRTDMGLSDTGLLRVNGSWQRAGSLRETPLQFTVDWDRAQLGQLSKLFSGSDKGWRGDVRLAASFSGTPASLQVSADSSIQNFHRYDIFSAEGLQLAAHCDGKYSSADGMMREILCSSPVGNGVVTLHGDAGRPALHLLDLTLNVENVPVSSVVQLARRAKKNLPVDLEALGSVQGNFAIKEDRSSKGSDLQGHGEVTNLRLESASTKAAFATGRVPFVLSAGAGNGYVSVSRKPNRGTDSKMVSAPNELHIEYGPFPLALGRPVAAQARGWIARSGFVMNLRGEGEISRTLRIASLLGLQATKANAEGIADMDLQVAGSWAENSTETPSRFSSPKVTGVAHLHDVRVNIRGVSRPIEISSADLKLLPDDARLEKLNAQAAEAHWTGSVTLPRGCGTPDACVAQVNLTAEQLALSDVYAWFSANLGEHHWYQVLTASDQKSPSFVKSLRASGNLNVTRLLAHNLTVNRVSTALDLDHGKLKLTNFRFDVFGGNHRGELQADFSGAVPAYSGSGTLAGAHLENAADAMQDSWISGTGSGSYQFTASGNGSDAFWKSAEGQVHFDLKDAALPHISLASDQDSLQIERWQGAVRLHDEKIEIDKSEIVAHSGAYEISGSASFGRELDFKLTQSGDKAARASAMSYSITGTVGEPLVTALPAGETRAQLKP